MVAKQKARSTRRTKTVRGKKMLPVKLKALQKEQGKIKGKINKKTVF
jgi:hypothetical protein